MKILMGIPAPGLKGGPPIHLPYLVEYFEQNDNFIIKTFFYGSRNEGIKENVFNKLLNTSKVLLQFVKLIIGFKPDVIHLNSAFDRKSILRDVPFSLICKLCLKPVLFKVHGSHYDLLFTRKWGYRIMIRLFFWGASKVGVLSECERKEFIGQFGNSSKLIIVKNIVPGVGNALVTTNVFNPLYKKFDALFVSRIEEGKGLEDLLQAVRHILKFLPKFLLAIAGSGNDLNKCKKLADELDIQKNVEWLGHIQNEHLNEVFNQSKIFVFTSHFPEGMPMSMIEALLHGMPVITTRTRFAVSYLKENENVLFVDQNNPYELSEKIMYLLNNESIHDMMRIKNVDFLSGFTQKKVGEEFSNIYLEMIHKV